MRVPCRSVVTSQPPSARRSARSTRVSNVIRVADAEVVDVGVEVLGDVRVVREVGIRRRHREVGELHPLARRVDVQRAVRGRHPVAVLEHPVAADAVGGLEAVEAGSRAACSALAAAMPEEPAPMTQTDGRTSCSDHTER